VGGGGGGALVEREREMMDKLGMVVVVCWGMGVIGHM